MRPKSPRRTVRDALRYFTPAEYALWGGSVALILLSAILLGDGDGFAGGATVAASLIGVTSLIFNAKGNPFGGRRAEVTVNRLSGRGYLLMAALTAAVTGVFFFILRALGTARLGLSTLSVATSFAAVYLTARRSPHYAIAYAANDLVLIALWVLAAIDEPHYLAVAVCFAVFFVNDIYGFIGWRRMARRQRRSTQETAVRP